MSSDNDSNSERPPPAPPPSQPRNKIMRDVDDAISRVRLKNSPDVLDALLSLRCTLSSMSTSASSAASSTWEAR